MNNIKTIKKLYQLAFDITIGYDVNYLKKEIIK